MEIRYRDTRKVAHRARYDPQEASHPADHSPSIAPLALIRKDPRRGAARYSVDDRSKWPCTPDVFSPQFRSSPLDAQQRTERVYRSWSSLSTSGLGSGRARWSRNERSPHDSQERKKRGRRRRGAATRVGAKRVGGGCDPLRRARVVGGGPGKEALAALREERTARSMRMGHDGPTHRAVVLLTISLGSRRGPIIPSSDWSAVLLAPSPRGSLSCDLPHRQCRHSSAPLLSWFSAVIPTHQLPIPSTCAPALAGPPRQRSVPFDIYVDTWALEWKYSSTRKQRNLTVFLPLFSGWVLLYILEIFFRSGFCSRYNSMRGRKTGTGPYWGWLSKS